MNIRKVCTLLLVVFAFAIMGSQGSCTTADANSVQAKEMERTAMEAEQRVGPVGITNYTERRFMKTILELRDTEVSTYSYYMDFTGKLHYLCPSIGYGLPYSTQYTNPEVKVYGSSGNISLPQLDPYGMYNASGVAATWIICTTGKPGEVEVVYWEPDLIVSPFKLSAASSLRLN